MTFPGSERVQGALYPTSGVKTRWAEISRNAEKTRDIHKKETLAHGDTSILGDGNAIPHNIGREEMDQHQLPFRRTAISERRTEYLSLVAVLLK